jgi:hypothetical protein
VSASVRRAAASDRFPVKEGPVVLGAAAPAVRQA